MELWIINQTRRRHFDTFCCININMGIYGFIYNCHDYTHQKVKPILINICIKFITISEAISTKVRVLFNQPLFLRGAFSEFLRTGFLALRSTWKKNVPCAKSLAALPWRKWSKTSLKTLGRCLMTWWMGGIWVEVIDDISKDFPHFLVSNISIRRLL